MLTQRFLEGMKQPQMILARLQIAHRQHKRPADSEFFFHVRGGRFALHRTEVRGDTALGTTTTLRSSNL